LKISEVDCVQPTGDLLEFVEIYNSSESSVPLAGISLELFDANGVAYLSVQLQDIAAEIAPAAYLVVGDFELLETIPPETLQLHVELDMPNDNAGVRILDDTGVVDSVVYGVVPGGLGEGNPTVAPTDENSIQRCPPENDTNDNLADFSVQVATPAGGCF